MPQWIFQAKYCCAYFELHAADKARPVRRAAVDRGPAPDTRLRARGAVDVHRLYEASVFLW